VSEPRGAFRSLAIEGDQPLTITSLSVEPGGVPWVLASGSLFYFDSEKFRPPVRSDADRGPFLDRFYGGADRGLFVAKLAPEGNEGRLYRLVDGSVVFETVYYHDVPHQTAALYVASSGRLFHYGQRFVAVRIDGLWHRSEALLNSRDVLVFEAAGSVHFYHDRHLYSLDSEGRLRHLELECPVISDSGRKRVHAALWGKDRLLIAENSAEEVHAFSVATGERLATDVITAEVDQRMRVHDLFPAGDGSVWILTHDWERFRFLFLRIPPEGAVETIEPTASLGWQNLRASLYPKSVLTCSDGSLWLGTLRRGLARWNNDRLEEFGWQDGLSGDFQFLGEGESGRVFAASRSEVFTFSPGAPSARPRWVERWHEHRLMGARPIRDLEGRVWMFLLDRPGQASRFDGVEWMHVDVPFPTPKVGRVLVDDAGHLLVAMGSHPDGCYDVSGEKVQRFTDLQDLLVAAVNRGVRRILPESSFQGCVIGENGTIWFGYQGHQSVQYFDGSRWDTLHLREPIYSAHESVTHGVLLKTQNEKYYRYDRGQLLEVPVGRGAGSRWLLGPQWLQPLEKELVERRPGELLMVERGDDSLLHLLVDHQELASEVGFMKGESLPADLTMITRGAGRGHWSMFPREPVYRILGDSVLRCDFRESPIAGREREIEGILEDRTGNLWIDLGSQGGFHQVFLRRMDGFKVHLNGISAGDARDLLLELEILQDGTPAPVARVFVRIPGGMWRGTDPRNARVVPGSAREIEILAMDPQGGVTPAILPASLESIAPRHP